jgi:redox-sensitive bicupin YhaK (pirin superfamily)
MQTTVHKAAERGYFDHGWLQTHHSFSFADYYNPEMMGFGALRVINDDVIAPGKGFGFHPHENMEIVTVVLSGALQHKDSMGNVSVIEPGEIQIMSAGTGVLHSEYNASSTDPVGLLQIWVYPKIANVTPRYDQKAFPQGEKNVFRTVVSPEKSDETLWINQDAYFSLAEVEEGKEVTYVVKRPGNMLYLFVIAGGVEVDGEKAGKRDAVAVAGAEKITVRSSEHAQALLMEIPA